jgi:hypothetical protein
MKRTQRNRTLLSRLARAWLYSVAAVLACGAVLQAQAQTAQPSFTFQTRSYIFPFPQTDQYQLHVLGDYLASGLASGLEEAFGDDGSVKVINTTKSSAGLARPDRTDWTADIEELTKNSAVHIAVLMMGINDIRNINLPEGRAAWDTAEWRDAYAEEADKLLRALKAKNIAVYWVGMPIMAKTETNDAMAKINDIIRERAYINGAKYIDSWTGFTDQLGGFSAFGPDLTGQNKRLRNKDGITFTSLGNRKLANYLEVVLRRDLAAARRERNLSLAGDEEEQNNLVPGRNRNTAPTDGGEGAAGTGVAANDAPTDENGDASSEPFLTEIGPAAVDGADVSQTPQVSAVDQAALSAFASGYAPPGETILGDIDAGVTSLATVSPIADLNADIGERRLPVTERLYYKVLVKGQALDPKPGRADDFRWPRS